MSFFFQKTPQAVKAAHNKPARASAATLHRYGCRACSLAASGAKTPFMPPSLAAQTDIYFLAEAPGRDEDEHTGKPLTGPSGSLLRSCIPRGRDASCSFDNIVNCRPPQNRTPVWQEIEACRPRRWKWISQAKPNLIVGLGAIPLSAILGSMDIQGMRGRLFAVNVGGHCCWFMPTYHPSFILRAAKNKDRPLNSMMGHCFKMDIRRAFELVYGLTPPTVDTEREVKSGIQSFSGPDDTDRVLCLLEAAKQADVKAVDIETRGLRPYSQGAAIVSASLSFEDTAFSFAIDHPGARYSEKSREKIRQVFADTLRDDSIKVAHNAPFEIEWLTWWLGPSIINHAAWEDTQMQAQFLDERLGKSYGGDDDRRLGYQKLDFLCKQHFGVAYKSLFKLDKKDMAKNPLAEVLLYNAVDTKYTLRLWHRQRDLLKKEGLLPAYQEALPRQTSVALMQSLGVDVDQAEVKACQSYLGGHIDDAQRDIDTETHRLGIGGFNPSSSVDTLRVFRDKLGYKEVEITEGGKTRFSVDKGVLDKIDHPLAKFIIKYRTYSKLRSTYVDPFELGKGSFVYSDGKIHSNFNTTFTETGRTSSDSPNMQNFPQRSDSWVRAQIVAPPGHLLVAFDYGQLEACTAAMCTKDEVLVKALREDYDIHQEWAEKAAAICPDLRNRYPKLRSVIKNKLVFPAIFGAQNNSIAGYLGISEEIVARLMQEFWDTFCGLKSWQDTLMQGYYTSGYVKSPTGRKHRYPLTRNQAINFPIQSFACDIVCLAMNRLSYDAVTTGKWHLHPVLNIHDDLSFVIPDDPAILDDAIKHVYKTMLTPDYPCVNVPLSVSCSVGTHWYDMSEVSKFWSHKDV